MLPSPSLPAIAGDVVWCLGLGLLLAMARDALGWGLGNGRVLCFLWDLAAFAAAAVLLRGFAAGVSAAGTVRWYMALSLLAGAAAWRWAAADALRTFGRALLRLLWRPWQWFCRSIATPCAKKVRNLMKSCFALHRIEPKIHEKKAKSRKKQLQNPVHMLYN